VRPLTLARLAFAVTGIIVVGIGIRVESAELRWSGIGLLAAAWLMRFAKDREGN
jgi:hypothetical protein